MRQLKDGQSTVVHIADVGSGADTVALRTRGILLEAPNWSADGRLLMNGEGHLFSWGVRADDAVGDGSDLQQISFTGLPPINNDHVLHPDGEHILMSAQDGQIYRGALTGGPVECLTRGEGGHFLHGISPDGHRIAYVDVDANWSGRLMVQDLRNGSVVHVPTGEGHVDGPEWTPDGRWILCSSEAFTAAPGHAQITRVRDSGAGRVGADAAGGPGASGDAAATATATTGGPGNRAGSGASGDPEHLLTSSRVDWFPHPSPDGRWATYLSYPAGTLGHPEDREVIVKLVELPDWSHAVQEHAVPGGQGTINVNSWAPDSQRFAFVSYPFA